MGCSSVPAETSQPAPSGAADHRARVLLRGEGETQLLELAEVPARPITSAGKCAGSCVMNEVAESGPSLFSQFLRGVGEGVVGMDGAKTDLCLQDKVLQKLGRHQALALRKVSIFNLRVRE